MPCALTISTQRGKCRAIFGQFHLCIRGNDGLFGHTALLRRSVLSTIPVCECWPSRAKFLPVGGVPAPFSAAPFAPSSLPNTGPMASRQPVFPAVVDTESTMPRDNPSLISQSSDRSASGSRSADAKTRTRSRRVKSPLQVAFVLEHTHRNHQSFGHDQRKMTRLSERCKRWNGDPHQRRATPV